MSEASDYFYGELRKYLRCAVCKSRVQKVERDYDVMRCEFTFVVRCHGRSEVVTLPSEVVENGTGISFGEAFASPALARFPFATLDEAACQATS